jgi:hypothetical protein
MTPSSWSFSSFFSSLSQNYKMNNYCHWLLHLNLVTWTYFSVDTLQIILLYKQYLIKLNMCLLQLEHTALIVSRINVLVVWDFKNHPHITTTMYWWGEPDLVTVLKSVTGLRSSHHLKTSSNVHILYCSSRNHPPAVSTSEDCGGITLHCTYLHNRSLTYLILMYVCNLWRKYPNFSIKWC